MSLLVGGAVGAVLIGLAGCESATAPVAGIVTAHVGPSQVVPNGTVRVMLTRGEEGSFYASRCAVYLQRHEFGHWVRSSVQPTPCSAEWDEVSPLRTVTFDVVLPYNLRHGWHRLEVVVSPFDLDGPPVVSVAPLEEATVISNQFWALAIR